MKTQDTDQIQIASLSTTRKNRAWFSALTAIVVVIIVISASVLLFTWISQSQSSGSSSGQWQQVLKGYTPTSLVTANSNPATLYICAALASSPNTTNGTVIGTNSGYTVLRSTDFGDHWQDISKNVGLVGSCEIAVNPANSNDIYVISSPEVVSDATHDLDVLKHSTDGGQTWNTLHPTLQTSGLAGLPATSEWHAQQMSIVGNHLFALQWLKQPPLHQPQGPEPPFTIALPRLLSSTDGGQTWTVLDKQFYPARLGVRSYDIDLANPSIIYELVGRPITPIEPANLETLPSTPPQPTGMNGDLYKSTDGGTQWQRILKDLPYGATMQLAIDMPNTVYAGGSLAMMPLAADQGGQQSISNPPPDMGGFHLQMSTDSGTTWRDVPAPRTPAVQQWFAGPNGQVYVYNGAFIGNMPGVSGTAVPATSVPGKAPQGSLPSTIVNGGLPVTNPALRIGSAALQGTAIPTSNKNQLFSYNPTTNSWNELTVPQSNGIILTITRASKNSSALWFVTSIDDKGVLYRSTV